jgi:hypothetical protein
MGESEEVGDALLNHFGGRTNIFRRNNGCGKKSAYEWILVG